MEVILSVIVDIPYVNVVCFSRCTTQIDRSALYRERAVMFKCAWVNPAADFSHKYVPIFFLRKMSGLCRMLKGILAPSALVFHARALPRNTNTKVTSIDFG